MIWIIRNYTEQLLVLNDWDSQRRPWAVYEIYRILRRRRCRRRDSLCVWKPFELASLNLYQWTITIGDYQLADQQIGLFKGLDWTGVTGVAPFDNQFDILQSPSLFSSYFSHSSIRGRDTLTKVWKQLPRSLTLIRFSSHGRGFNCSTKIYQYTFNREWMDNKILSSNNPCIQFRYALVRQMYRLVFYRQKL